MKKKIRRSLSVLCSMLLITALFTSYIPTASAAANNGASLSYLTISEGSLDPAFNASVFSYTAKVAEGVSSINVTPTATDAAILVEGKEVVSGSPSQDIPLEIGKNTISIEVTTEDASTRKYTVTVDRAAPLSSNAELSSLSLSEGALAPAFDAGTVSYTATVDENISSITMTPEAADAAATITVEGKEVTSSSPSQDILLDTGKNTVNINVTAQDGTMKKYTVDVTRNAPAPAPDPAPSAVLNGLAISEGKLAQAFDAGVFSYTATVDEKVSVITLVPTSFDTTARITVNGKPVENGAVSEEITLNKGDNKIEITVSNGTASSTYTVNVNRKTAITYAAPLAGPILNALSGDATLLQVSLSYFDIYDAVIDNTAGTVTATVYGSDYNVYIMTNSSAATYVIKNNPFANYLQLNPGDNVYTIEVTAEDGTKKNYTMTITRLLSPDATMAYMFVNPAFGADAVMATIDNAADTITATVYGQNHVLSLQPTVSGSTWVVKQGGDALPVDAGTVPVSLDMGDNLFAVEVTSEDGSATKTYTMTLTRVVSSTTDFVVYLYDTAQNYENMFYYYGVDFNSMVVYGPDHQVGVVPSAQSSTVVIKDQQGDVLPALNGFANILLAMGDNTITIEVTAEDGTFSSNTLLLTREQSADTTLSMVQVYTPADMHTEFAMIDNVNFTVSAQTYGASQTLRIQPTVANSTWVLKQGGVEITPASSTEADVTLEPGINTFDLEVTAEGGTMQTYIVTIERLTSTNPALQAVTAYATGTNVSTGAVIDDPALTATAHVLTAQQIIYATPLQRMTTVLIQDSLGTDVTNQEVTLNPGANNFTILLTTESGASETYTYILTLAQPKITFNTNGGSAIDPIYVDLNSTVPVPADPTRTGYAFAGWYKNAVLTIPWNFATDKILADTTLYAKWTQTVALVTFNSNGGSTVADINADINTAIAAPADPTRTGYAFAGWYKDAGLTMPWDFMNDTVVADTTLYAKWTPTVTFTVNFYSLGSKFSTVTSEYNALLTEPAPYWPGHVVEGWYKEPGFLNKWNFATGTVTANMNLYAKWVAEVYEIMFDSMGGSDVPSIFVSGDQYISFPAPPTKPGFVFAGWYQADLTTPYYNNYHKPSSNMLMFAKWVVETHTVTFNSQLGSFVPSVVAEVNTTIAEPAAPTRTGYTFGGWYKEAGLVNPWDFASDTVTTDITLYAKWVVNTYTVTFEANSGSTVPSVQADYNTKITEPSVPTRTEHVFGGWYKESGLVNAWNFASDVVTGNTTLYAKWTINQYAVTFESSPGSAIGSIQADYGAAIAKPSDPTRTGYTLVGWYKEAGLINAWDFNSDTVTTDITLYAKWVVNTYTVTFETNSGSPVPSVQAEHNTTIAEPPVPTRTEHVFGGWYKESGLVNAWNFASDVVTGNTTLYAKWTVKKYTVTFNSSPGSPISPIQADYGATMAKPSNPTRTGYTFDGWYKEAALKTLWDFAADKVTGNTTLYAKWNPIAQYTVKIAVNNSTYGKAAGGGLYYAGVAAPLRANPYTGYRFVKWTIGTTTVSTNPIFDYTVTKNVTINAEFAAIGTTTITSISSAGYNSAKLSWSAVSGVSGYGIFRSTSATGTYSEVKKVEGSLTYTDTGLTTGKGYYYRIKAYYKVGTAYTYGKNYSAYKYVKPIPSTAGGVKAVRNSSSSIKISWNAVAGATSYQVYRATSKTGTYKLVKTTSGLEYLDTGLTKGRTYYYKIRAYRLVGSTKVYSNMSGIVSAKP